MEDNYVRKDVFDEVIRRMEAMNAASEARITAQMAELRAELKISREENLREFARLAENIRSVKETAEKVNSRSMFWTRLMGIVFWACTAIIAIAQAYLAVKGG